MSHGGPSNFEIKLVESYSCKTLKDLLAREKYYINDLKPVCNVSMVDKAPDQVEDEEDDEDKQVKEEEISLYEETQDIDSARYETLCCKILTTRAASEKDQLEAKKYWFTHEFVKNNDADIVIRCSIFDESMRNKEKERLMYFAQSFFNPDTVRLSCNPYSAKFDQLPHIVEAIRDISRLLGFKNTPDGDVDSNTFNQDTLEGSLEEIIGTARKIRKLLKRPITSQVVSVRTAIESLNVCFRAFGLELKVTEQHRPRTQGSERMAKSMET